MPDTSNDIFIDSLGFYYKPLDTRHQLQMIEYLLRGNFKGDTNLNVSN